MRGSRVYATRRHAPSMRSMMQDTLTRAAKSSLKVAAGAILTDAMMVLLWVVVIEILDRT
jgi:threonine/homoserine/homoserine lactone efflux protein